MTTSVNTERGRQTWCMKGIVQNNSTRHYKFNDILNKWVYNYIVRPHSHTFTVKIDSRTVSNCCVISSWYFDELSRRGVVMKKVYLETSEFGGMYLPIHMKTHPLVDQTSRTSGKNNVGGCYQTYYSSVRIEKFSVS
jgi:hypothetical protein